MIGLVERHFGDRGSGVEFEMEARWVRRRLPARAERILEVGCGSGSLFQTIGHHRLVGLDHLAEGLARTRARHADVPLLCADGARLPFPDGSFDAVATQHVIEHLEQAGAACREWHRVLRPGGDLLILTPNARFVDPSVFDDPTHVHVFEARELANLLEGCGFAVIDLRTLGLPWFRRYNALPSGWRLRRFVTERAEGLSSVAPLRWRGQTLCCAARRHRE